MYCSLARCIGSPVNGLFHASAACLQSTHVCVCACVCHTQDPTGEAVSMVEKHLTFYELDLGLNHVARYVI